MLLIFSKLIAHRGCFQASAMFKALSSQTSLARLNVAKFGMRALISNMQVGHATTMAGRAVDWQL